MTTYLSYSVANNPLCEPAICNSQPRPSRSDMRSTACCPFRCCAGNAYLWSAPFCKVADLSPFTGLLKFHSHAMCIIVLAERSSPTIPVWYAQEPGFDDLNSSSVHVIDQQTYCRLQCCGQAGCQRLLQLSSKVT